MSTTRPIPRKTPLLGTIRRRAVALDAQELVRTGSIGPGGVLPIILEAVVDGVALLPWANSHRSWITDLVLEHGGILFRNFEPLDPERFQQLIAAVAGDPIPYRERSSPRTQVTGNIYTSTDYRADHRIFLHNENSYQDSWPMKIFFCCRSPAETGGETPIVDCRRVYARISPGVRARFARKGWMYARNFGDGFGLPWQDVFGTTDRAAVESYCRRRGIALEWKQGNRLRIRSVGRASYRHNLTNEKVWFNHAAFFHVSTLEDEVRNELLAEFADEDLPTQTYYGDGSSIEPEVLDELQSAYTRDSIVFPWRRGDILMLDNMLVAHGRMPYTGSREVLVGMAEPVKREDFAR